VTGHEEGHDLVLELEVGHAGAVLVMRGQQSLQEIFGVGGIFAAIFDDALNDFAEAIANASGEGLWQGKIFRQYKRKCSLGHEAFP
jgi:hypothetical protein